MLEVIPHVMLEVLPHIMLEVLPHVMLEVIPQVMLHVVLHEVMWELRVELELILGEVLMLKVMDNVCWD